MSQFLGRYTAVIFTTIIFVVLVVSVLGVNFNLSFQTEANAEVVNIAGRQRMLSQRVAKSLGNVKARYESGQEFEAQLNELKSASTLFNRTITAFKNGGSTVSTKSGESTLSAVAGGSGLQAVDEALQIWTPLFSSIENVIGQLEAKKVDSASVSDALILRNLSSSQEYIDSNINTLLRLMNDLTNYTESIANDAAEQSRQIQTAGIVASLLCFAIIMYLIFGQLRRSDRAAASARQETTQIFETVDQGLFLIDRDLSMGSQHSRALESIFSTQSFEGRNFRQFISALVSPGDLEKVERYLKLLFDPHKKQRLLRDLNPLNQLAIQVDEYGQLRNKFLSFSFSRVLDDDQIVGILSSVADITKEVQLAKELEAETKRNEQQLEMISALMGADSDLLPEFLKKSNGTYQEINNILRDPAKTTADFQYKGDQMLALIHKVKGESAALGLGFISETCHQFESQVQALVSKPTVTGEEFLSLTVMLDQLISTNEQIESVFSAVLSRGRPQADESTTVSLVQDDTNAKLTELATEIAERQGKMVHLSVAGFDSSSIATEQKLDIVSLASQLLRNAVAHGIEPSLERQSKNKDVEGQVTLALYDQGNKGFRLVCEDDGKGMDFAALTQKAVENGLISKDESKSIAPGRIINLLLSNRLSSKDEADEDAGRGVGLTVVGDISTRLGGKVALQTKPSGGTRFTIRFPKPSIETQLNERVAQSV